MRALKLSLEIDPKDAMTYNNLGLIYAGKGDTDEAIANYKLGILYDATMDGCILNT